MNRAKLREFREETEESINFSALFRKVIPAKPRDNGTPAGVSALAASIQRGNAYVEAQRVLNQKCNPVQTQLANTLIQEA